MIAYNGGPAFPTELHNPGNVGVTGFDREVVPPKSFAEYSGMSLRDYFAAHCPITFNEALDFNVGGGDDMKFFTAMRLEYADAMIAERNKSK